MEHIAFTHKLKYPIMIDGGKVEEITARIPSAGDLEYSMKHKEEHVQQLHLISAITKIAPEDVRRILLPDYASIGRKLSSFLGEIEDV